MSKTTTQKIIIVLILSALNFTVPITISAQDNTKSISIGIAQPIPYDGELPPEGSIISHIESSYRLSSEPYDKSMIGVTANGSALEIIPTDLTEPTIPIITSGKMVVRVNKESGDIKKGDPITSSSTEGVGMKADKSGFVLGISENDFSGEGEGLVVVNLDIKFSFAQDSPQSELISQRLLDVIKLSTIALYEEPKVVFKYVVSALVVLITVIFSFFTFGRTVKAGVEAIGRNPLASADIKVGIIFNTLLGSSIIIAGVTAAYFIITF